MLYVIDDFRRTIGLDEIRRADTDRRGAGEDKFYSVRSSPYSSHSQNRNAAIFGYVVINFVYQMDGDGFYRRA